MRSRTLGPRTEAGKQASRCNAVGHGFTAETVIGALEDAEDYQAFEAAITADYDAPSAVERELVLRLASVPVAATSCYDDGKPVYLKFKPIVCRTIAKTANLILET